MSETVTETKPETAFGPTGKVVYERTYSRKQADGTQETWPDTVARVVTGNLSLAYGHPSTWDTKIVAEAARLQALMEDFKIIPGGRHLWASGVKGRQYLFNCHVAGWGKALSEHFSFTFLRLMEGGGVGANYSSRFLREFPLKGGSEFHDRYRQLQVHIVCDPSHADYDEMKAAGLLSEEYDSDWDGAYEVEDSREGWSDALVDLIDTYQQDGEPAHQQRVYDVTNVRPKGSRLKTFGGTASGPGPFATMLHEVSRVLNEAGKDSWHLTPVEAMEIDHAVAECVVSGGTRRSARMAICHWNDPYIEDFLDCKRDSGKHWTTNVSVEIDHGFTNALHSADTASYLKATGIMRRVVEGMLTNGEPGLWNSSLSNEGEPGEVVATNPCGEIALEEWENCNLGHINLDAFAPTVKHAPSKFASLVEAHQLMTRFLIRATYGDVNDPKQADRLAANRRIGVGHLGVQGYYAKQGIRYSMAPKNRYVREELRLLAGVVRREARDYAFQLRIPEPVKVTTVAPTGTIAKMPGVTEGIHPIYSRFFIRRIRFNKTRPEEAQQIADAEEQGFYAEPCQYDTTGNTIVVEFPTKEMLVQQVEDLGFPAATVESADEISVPDMLRFQAMYQELWADNAVSFTVNVPAEEHQSLQPDGSFTAPSPERVTEVMSQIIEALPSLKGTTLMIDGSRPQAPYERITEEQYNGSLAVMLADGVDDECATGACPVR